MSPASTTSVLDPSGHGAALTAAGMAAAVQGDLHDDAVLLQQKTPDDGMVNGKQDSK